LIYTTKTDGIEVQIEADSPLDAAKKALNRVAGTAPRPMFTAKDVFACLTSGDVDVQVELLDWIRYPLKGIRRSRKDDFDIFLEGEPSAPSQPLEVLEKHWRVPEEAEVLYNQELAKRSPQDRLPSPGLEVARASIAAFLRHPSVSELERAWREVLACEDEALAKTLEACGNRFVRLLPEELLEPTETGDLPPLEDDDEEAMQLQVVSGRAVRKLKLLDWTFTPGARKRSEGPYSGEEYRDDILIPSLKAATQNNELILLDLDGTAGLAASFVSEVFEALPCKVGQSEIASLAIRFLEDPDTESTIHDYLDWRPEKLIACPSALADTEHDED
jgi:hypothetical protein